MDIGNTNITFGIYQEKNLVFDWRIFTDKNKTSDEYGFTFREILKFGNIDPEMIDDCIIASVVPNLMHTIPNAFRKYLHLDPFIVEEDTYLGIENAYGKPSEVGADRLVNAVCGCEKYHPPLIIVDIGTAVTFDYISKDRKYYGGAIAPGIGIASEALFLRAAKLSKVELEVPKKVIGNNTEESIQSGLVYGYISLIDGIIERMMKESHHTKEDVTVICTGGFSSLIAKNSKYIQRIDKQLTLEGLRIIYELNKGRI